MNAYEKLQTARSQTRPTARSYIEKLFQERTELHGDRKYADDAAIIGHRPVICFVDTSGAFCGEEAEERGQGQAIADNLMQMMGLETPIITIVIGEGGSGGALGLSVANKLYMLENAVFSVISPEGCASILWEDAKLAPDAAECLHITAEDMKEFGVAEEIIPEDFVHFGKMCDEMKEKLILDLKGWSKKTGKELSEERYQRFRKLGRWAE